MIGFDRIGRVTRTAALVALATACGGPSEEAPRAAIDLLPVPLRTGASGPSLAAADGRLAVGWIEQDPTGPPAFRVAVRKDGAWSESRPVVSDPRLLVNWADPPALAWLHDGSLVAEWILREGTTGTRVFTAVSRDDGRSWGAPASPHRDRLPSEHGLPALAPSAGSGFEIVWLDGRAGAESSDGTGATRLYHARWTETGFGAETLLDDRVCDCCKIGLAALPEGTLVAYRDRSEDEVRDISLVRTRSAGWSDPAPLHDDGWTIKACPTNGPSVVASGPEVAAVWFTAAAGAPRVLAAWSRDGGDRFEAPRVVAEAAAIGRVDAAALGDGRVVVVWMARSGDRASAVLARTIDPTGAMGRPVVFGDAPAGRAGGFPRVVAVGPDEVVVAWTASGGDAPTVRAASWRPTR